ncbi:MAG: DUF4910 domain-containing protein [Candidatus Zixiibacteriota bacterium]|nr:MAG: DUF4910 domain-containing protein [candidate division Zixibacteria bacterium]
MIELLKELWYKRRDIVSDGYDEALMRLAEIIPFEIKKIKTGTKCWTWTVPEKWTVREAYIEDLDGNRLLDVSEHPLHVLSYSLPISDVVTHEELLEHLHTNPRRPGAIPFEFKYYERDWGFCVQHERLREFSKDKYRILIDSSFEDGHLKVGDFTIKGKSDEIIALIAHLCHPAMANDDMSGVVVLVDIARQLLKQDNHFTYKFILVPETIGSVAYLSQNEDLIPKLKYGLFLEMLGNNNIHALQTSAQGNTRIDRIARYVLNRAGPEFREGPFRKVVGNDEMVFNGPGVGVPTISISRYPYPEYHTSDDNPGIISEDRLLESKALVLELLHVLDNDYVPRRTFKGPVFLSGYGLWVDWRTNRPLNAAIEDIMLRFEGQLSVFDIADELGLDFHEILDYVNKFEQNGLVVRS